MAKPVKLSSFQEMQRGELLADRAIGTQDLATVDPLSGAVVAAPSIADPSAIAQDLARLGVRSACDPEMALGEIKGLVREAAEAEGVLANDDAISAEAERIWTSFGDLRAPGLESARVYDVDGRTGEVRDWRRPDPGRTPDRGDVTAVHTVSDDTPFSGGGATGEEPSQLIPADQDFSGRLYREAPELASIAERLIGEHGFLSDLVNCEIRYYWRRKTGVSKGRVKIGFCKRASDLLGHFSGADFIVWLSATTARDGKFTDRQVEAAVFHQLLHIETDDEGNFISARHDFEGFAQEIRHYGVWTEDLKTLVPAVTAAQQMGLFDATEDDEAEDEGDGSYWVAVEEPDTSGELPTGDEIDEIYARDGDLLADPAVI